MIEAMTRRLVVSACLLGAPCRFDALSRASETVREAVGSYREQGGEVVAVCPEELGGLGTPRPAAELRGGDGEAVLLGTARVVRLVDGGDVTREFLRGARAAAELGVGATEAILKARSPSCGCGQAHRDGGPKQGDGVFAALLRRAGVSLRTEEDFLSDAGASIEGRPD